MSSTKLVGVSVPILCRKLTKLKFLPSSILMRYVGFHVVLLVRSHDMVTISFFFEIIVSLFLFESRVIAFNYWISSLQIVFLGWISQQMSCALQISQETCNCNLGTVYYIICYFICYLQLFVVFLQCLLLHYINCFVVSMLWSELTDALYLSSFIWFFQLLLMLFSPLI